MEVMVDKGELAHETCPDVNTRGGGQGLPVASFGPEIVKIERIFDTVMKVEAFARLTPGHLLEEIHRSYEYP